MAMQQDTGGEDKVSGLTMRMVPPFTPLSRPVLNVRPISTVARPCHTKESTQSFGSSRVRGALAVHQNVQIPNGHPVHVQSRAAAV